MIAEKNAFKCSLGFKVVQCLRKCECCQLLKRAPKHNERNNSSLWRCLRLVECAQSGNKPLHSSAGLQQQWMCACFVVPLNLFSQQGAVNHFWEQTTWLFTLRHSSTHAALLSISLVPASMVGIPVLDLSIVCKSILFKGCRWLYL